MRKHIIAVLLLIAGLLPAQSDSLYARRVIEKLCAKKCFGRGYVRKGLARAEKFIVSELRSIGASPYSEGQYSFPFSHPVNTFPGKCKVKLDGRRLEPGMDFIVDPSSRSLSGRFPLRQTDSVTFQAEQAPLAVTLHKKLTFGVAQHQGDRCVVELDRNRITAPPRQIKIKLRARQTEFTSSNIVAFIDGTQSDSMVVFTAHYDHLGGMGRRTFFPGANDNASGVSMVLNLARYYKAHPPRHKTVFIFFAGEEAGLLGSAHLVKSGLLDLKKIRFLINLDLLGTGDDGIMVVNGAVFEEQYFRMVALNDAFSLVQEVKKRGKAANSDHYYFTEAGVPSFFIYTLGGTTAYHDVRDVPDQLPLTDYKDVMQLLTLFVGGL